MVFIVDFWRFQIIFYKLLLVILCISFVNCVTGRHDVTRDNAKVIEKASDKVHDAQEDVDLIASRLDNIINIILSMLPEYTNSDLDDAINDIGYIDFINDDKVEVK